LTESDPLFYQANLFLGDLYLYDKTGNKVKVDLQLGWEHKDDTILKGDPTGELKSAGLFNKSSQSFKNLTDLHYLIIYFLFMKDIQLISLIIIKSLIHHFILSLGIMMEELQDFFIRLIYIEEVI